MTKGMSANVWSGEHIDRLKQMNSEGTSYEDIAEVLGRSVKSIKAKLAMLRMTTEQLRAYRAKKRKYAADQYPGRKAIGSGFSDLPGARPDEDIIAERDRRLALSPRSLTAAFCNDPLPGYSALDRRVEQ
jgi:hypothetical protein